ncbi:MAG: hypothetical protein KIT34_03620 [Cyanobacteria bacterium TGS_CYA1]|nr:hypothetical protein [Cyanobacteria bacterium TGS_CYA1]
MRLNFLDKHSRFFLLALLLAQAAPTLAQANKSQLLQPEAPQYAPVSDIAPTQPAPQPQSQPQYQNNFQPQSQYQAQQPYQQQPYQSAPPQYQQQPYQGQQQYQQQPYANQAPVYREQYSGNYMPPPQGQGQYQGGAQTGYYPPRPMYQTPNMPQAGAGVTLNVTLQTAISTQIARQGDLVQGVINQNINLGNGGFIPAGTMVTGTVTDSIAGRRLSRSGLLSISFNAIRLPSGQSIPITAHLVGDLGKYSNKGSGGNDVYRGEGWGAKAGQTLIRGGAGAGLGAALGTGVGAIAGGGHGAGMGAWSGAAIGGGIGVADMLLRKGKDVLIPAGTSIQIQLDAPVGVPGGSV